MRVVAGFEAMVEAPQRACRRAVALTAFGMLTLSSISAFAFDGSTANPPAKISPKGFTSAEQALRAGIDDLKAGDAAAAVAALTYAAEGGEPIARWKLGEIYADGVVVVPAALVEEVAALAAEQERLEEWIMREVEKGVPLPGLYPPNAETRVRYEAERG